MYSSNRGILGESENDKKNKCSSVDSMTGLSFRAKALVAETREKSQHLSFFDAFHLMRTIEPIKGTQQPKPQIGRFKLPISDTPPLRVASFCISTGFPALE